MFQGDKWKESVGDDYYEEPDEDFKKRNMYSELMAHLSEEEKSELGHHLDDMLMMCSFNGLPCRPK